jgi:hypothetical protein
LKVGEFLKKHLRHWLQDHTTWNPNTQRNVIGSVKAAFKFCCKFDDLETNPIAGYEKPTAIPRVTAFTPEEENAMYETAYHQPTDDRRRFVRSAPQNQQRNRQVVD